MKLRRAPPELPSGLMASTRTEPILVGAESRPPARPYGAGGALNLYLVTAVWVGLALLASLVSIRIAIPVALVEIVVGALAGNIPGIKEHITQTEFTTFLATGRIGDPHLPGGGGDRPGVAAQELEGKPVDRVRLVPLTPSRRLRVLSRGPRLAPPRGGDRRRGTQYDLGSGCLRGDDRDRVEPPRHRQAHPGRLLCDRPWDRARPRRVVRQLRMVADRVRGGDACLPRGPPEPHTPRHRSGRPPGERAGDQVHPGRAVGPRGPGRQGRERSGAPRLPGRTRRGRWVPPRPHRGGPATGHRLFAPHTVLLLARGHADRGQGARLGCWCDRRPLARQGHRQVRRH